LRFPEQDEFARAHGAVKRDRVDGDDKLFFIFVIIFICGGRSGGITR
jgi:hypothetical protein